MDATLRENIFWVGYVDWTVRDFHGYHTNRGSTYNAYLVCDEKTALIDTVKAPYVCNLLQKVGEHTSLDAVDYIVVNHAEPDHSGALPEVAKACRNAEIVCNAKCRKALEQHFITKDWKFRVVDEGETLSLGKRSLTFVNTPMAHWPESMFTYVPEEELLFSMDAFGQHYASAGRYDRDEDLSVVMQEAKTYYANILMPYGKQVAKVMERAKDIPIRTVATSHGVIWEDHIGEILAAYGAWTQCKPAAKALVIYDSMWQSTERMAHAIWDAAQRQGVDAKLFNIRKSNITILATEVLDAATVAFGSPTLNRTMMPEMGALLTYLKGLRPLGKAGFAFGSYGWAKGGAQDVNDYLKDLKFDILREPLQVQYAPTSEVLAECRAAGEALGRKAEEIARQAE